jgi:hypothetical protein
MAQNLAMRQADFGKSGFATPPLARFVWSKIKIY